MKINDVRILVVHAEMPNRIFVKIETDQDGLYGWKTRAVTGAIEDCKPMLIGEDPTRIEFLDQKLYRQSFRRPGVILTNIRAADGAILDW